MMKRLISLLLALCLAAVSCIALAESESEVPAEAETAAETTEETGAETAEPVLLATVNGTEIYEDDYDLQYWISYYLYTLSSSGYDTSDPDLLNDVNQYSLYNTLNFTLLRQKAEELGLAEISDEEKAGMEEEARESWASVLESYETGYFGITDDSTEEERSAARLDALAVLEGMGYTEDSYVKEMVDGSITNLLIERVQNYAADGLEVTDEEVADYYSELAKEDAEAYANDISNYEFMTQYYGQDSYYTPEGYRGITHILLDVDEELINAWKDLTARLEEQLSKENEEATDAEAETAEDTETAEEPVTQEMVDAARQAILDSVSATVDEIMAKYNEGTSFEDLILEYGTDPGMQDEATRAEGYHIHEDSILYDSDFVKGAMALEKIGDISEPVISQFGVHILQYLKDIPGGITELTDGLKEELREALMTEKQQDAFNTLLDKWMAEADIQYTEAGEAWKLPEEETEDEAETEAPAGAADTEPAEPEEIIDEEAPAFETPNEKEGTTDAESEAYETPEE